MRAGRQTHPPHGHLQRPLAGVVQCADFPELTNRNLRVIEAAGALHATNALDAGAHVGGRRPAGLAAQFLIRDCGNLDMQIDPVQQGAADLA